jgi:hypothetical protein
LNFFFASDRGKLCLYFFPNISKDEETVNTFQVPAYAGGEIEENSGYRARTRTTHLSIHDSEPFRKTI